MITRILFIIALCGSLSFLTYAAYVTRQGQEERPVDSTAARVPIPPLEPQEIVSQNPQVPEPLPDLTGNYMFDEDRVFGGLQEEKKPEPKKEEAPRVDMATVTFVGSIITKDLTQALISYTENSQPADRSRSRRSRSRSSSSSKKYIRLLTGDDFFGYLVESVTPDQIVFAKGEEKIEKKLFGVQKARLEAPPQRQAPAPEVAPAPPPQTVPSPEQQQSTPRRTVSSSGSRSRPTRNPPSEIPKTTPAFPPPNMPETGGPPPENPFIKR